MFLNNELNPTFKTNLEKLSFEFAIEIRKICKELQINRDFNTSSQLERASSSISANICESSYAASRKDFINKLRIASKEASECVFWMSLLKQSGCDKITNESLIQLQHIQMMLNKSIATAVKNSHNNPG
jgi:four helix bundle protein